MADRQSSGESRSRWQTERSRSSSKNETGQAPPRRLQNGVCCIAVRYYFSVQTFGGGSDEKTHDDFDCSGTRAGIDGVDGQCANSADRSCRCPWARAERDPDRETGGMPGMGSPLPARKALGLRPLSLLVPLVLEQIPVRCEHSLHGGRNFCIPVD